MPYRSFRINFRTRSGVDPTLWNQFWNNLYWDLNDVVGSGVDPIREIDLGIATFTGDYEITASGLASKELL